MPLEVADVPRTLGERLRTPATARIAGPESRCSFDSPAYHKRCTVARCCTPGILRSSRSTVATGDGQATRELQLATIQPNTPILYSIGGHVLTRVTTVARKLSIADHNTSLRAKQDLYSFFHDITEAGVRRGTKAAAPCTRCADVLTVHACWFTEIQEPKDIHKTASNPHLLSLFITS